MNDDMRSKEPYREFYGWASHGEDGILYIGTPGPNGDGLVGIPLTKDGKPGWFSTNEVAIYVTRYSHDGSIAEISIAIEDGLTYCDFDFQSQLRSFPPWPNSLQQGALLSLRCWLLFALSSFLLPPSTRHWSRSLLVLRKSVASTTLKISTRYFPPRTPWMAGRKFRATLHSDQ